MLGIKLKEEEKPDGIFFNLLYIYVPARRAKGMSIVMQKGSYEVPEDTAMQGMHLQLINKAALVGIFSYVNKGVKKENVREREK